MLPFAGVTALQGSGLQQLGGVLRHAVRALSTAAPAPAAPVAEKTSFGGLKDEDRIFQNIYGRHDISIKVGGFLAAVYSLADQQPEQTSWSLSYAHDCLM